MRSASISDLVTLTPVSYSLVSRTAFTLSPLFVFGRFRLFSGCRGEIQAAAVEVDRVDEVLFVAEAAGRVLHPLDLGVDGFAGRVGDPVLEVGDDVGEAAFHHAGDF